MGLFKEISRFGDLFHSIRQHQQYFVVDLKMPSSWEVEKLIETYKGKVAYKVNKEYTDFRLISFFATATDNAVTEMINIIEEVIRLNKEAEEKRSLLVQKKIELENMFNSFSLNDLKKISFNVETQLELDSLSNLEEKTDGNGTEGSDLVEEGEVKRPEGSPKS
tara:strand:+ start:3356 stop:3847 length:492 start_codon:yes stop_codon:yes gene_type:complete